MRLLRRALEEISGQTNDEDKGIVIKGPLSDEFTDALNKEYAKEPEETGAAMESAAIDTMMMQQLAKSMNIQNNSPTDSFQTVYGVSKDEVTQDTIVEVASELSAQQDTRDFILIIDGTTPGDNGDSNSAPIERLEILNSALECLVIAHGGKVYSSLTQYAKTRK